MPFQTTTGNRMQFKYEKCHLTHFLNSTFVKRPPPFIQSATQILYQTTTHGQRKLLDFFIFKV